MNHVHLVSDGSSSHLAGLFIVTDATNVAVDADALPEVTLIGAKNSTLLPADAATYLGLSVEGQSVYGSYGDGVYVIKVDPGVAITNGYGLTHFFGWVTAVVDGVATKTPIAPFRFVSQREVAKVVANGANSATSFEFAYPDFGSATDYTKNMLVRFLSGNLRGQVRKCSAMNSGTVVLTVSEAFTGTPTAGDLFMFVAD